MTSDYNMVIFKKKKLKKMMELRTTSSKSVTIICRKDQQYHQIFWITWNKVYKLRVRKLKWGGTGRNITQYFQSSIWIANIEVSKETLVCKIVIVMKVDGYSLRRRGRPTTHQPDRRRLWTTKFLLRKLSTAIWEQPVGSNRPQIIISIPNCWQ